MPSPFPGMDPYLEERSIWPDVHSSLISYIREALQPQVRPKYVARIGERFEVVETRKGYIPHVLVVQSPRSLARSMGHSGTLAADEPLRLRVLDEERRMPYIEIIYRESGDVVTEIEVIGPANKSGEGRAQCIRKQQEFLSTYINLVEIDLLGEGETPSQARLATMPGAARARYVVCVSRSSERELVGIYSFGLQDRLPRCRIPLRSADPDVVLDLPVVFARCYDVGGYDLLVDYSQPPPVALSESEAEWVRAHLQGQATGMGLYHNESGRHYD